MNPKQKILSAAFALGFGLLAAQTPISLQQLQTATNKVGTEGGKARQVGVTNSAGKQRYVAFPDVLVTPINYTPATTGNTTNLSRFVERNDSLWYVDFEGDSKFLGKRSSPDQDWLKVRDNGIPYAITDTIYTDNIVAINGRNYFPDVELNVYDSASIKGAAVAAIGNRGGRFAGFNTVDGKWTSYGQEGSLGEVIAGGGTTKFAVYELTGGGSPGSPSGTFEEHFNIDLINDAVTFDKYPSSRDDSGTAVNFLGTDALGKMVSNPLSEIPGAAAWNYQKAVSVTGGSISVTVPIPTASENLKIALYREGVKIRFGDDYTVSGTTFLLTVPADAETFEIYTQL